MAKKLLFIQTLNYLDNFLSYIRSKGVYVYLFKCKCPTAKEESKSADEVIECDKFDEDYFVEFARDHDVNAIYAHDSEDLMEPLRRMNERIGNHFFHTKEQFDVCINKVKFKRFCQSYGLDTPKLHYYGSLFGLWRIPFKPFKLPVIVKPSDGIGSSGLSVVRKLSQLPKAVYRAIRSSRSRHIMIEKFIDGNEISATYVVQNGICRLVLLYDKYKYRSISGVDYPCYCVAPSLYLDLFMNEVDPKIQQLVKDNGYDNYTFFIQAIVKDEKIFVLETGLRREGSDTNLFTSYFAKQDYTNFLIDFLLGLDTDYDVKKEDPSLNGHLFIGYDPIINEGTIHKIENLEKPLRDKRIFYHWQFKYEGDYSWHGGMFGGLLCNYSIDAENADDAIEIINNIDSLLKVTDDKGNGMIDRSVNLAKILEKYR